MIILLFLYHDFGLHFGEEIATYEGLSRISGTGSAIYTTVVVARYNSI
jgi:hypothetical protein